MNDNYNPTATEVRILTAEGGILRWDGDAAETIAQILSAFAEAARAKGKPLPTPIVIPPCKVHRKVTVVEGIFHDYDNDGMSIDYEEKPGRKGPGRQGCGVVDLLDILPDEATTRAEKEGISGDDDGIYQGERRLVYRFEVEIIDPADMARPKPNLEVVPS